MMLNVKVLGSGCANCKKLEASVRKVVTEQGLEAEVEKVTDYGEIMQWNVLATPGLVVNDKVVATGRVPSEKEIKEWLKS
jgi:small redox-active disulfide protein 2